MNNSPLLKSYLKIHKREIQQSSLKLLATQNIKARKEF